MVENILTRNVRSRAVLVALAGSLFAVGCGLDNAAPPSLTAPSEFGLSVTLTATPDQLPRDGSSQSTITVSVRDAQNRPVSGQRLSIGTSVGSVSQGEVVTGSDGRASFTFIAPPAGTVGNTAIIQVIPVGDNAGSAIGRSVSILLVGIGNSTAPTPSFTFSPSGPTLKDNVVFDATASTDEGAACSDTCTYAWDFGGEDTKTGRIVNYRFQSIRTYAVKLTVTDRAGASASTSQNVVVTQGTAPTASFTFSPSSPGQFENVNFTAEASRVGVAGRKIDTYAWNFGDGVTGGGMVQQHKFNVLGTFPVTLTVTDSAGVQGTQTTNVIVVNGVTASFTVSPSTSPRGLPVFFDTEGSQGSDCGFGCRSQIEKYIWNFGDSTELIETTNRTISHTYATSLAPGTYTINLTVIDKEKRRATTTRTITLN